MNSKELFPWSRGRSLSADPFRAMRESMDEMLARFGAMPSTAAFGFGAQDGIGVPHVDIAEEDGALEVTMDLPGVSPSDMDVSIENGDLVVSGHREEEKTEGGKDKSFHRVERYRGRFVRRIALPAGIDESAVEARHGNGVLKVRIPKLPEAAAKQKRIEIRSDGA